MLKKFFRKKENDIGQKLIYIKKGKALLEKEQMEIKSNFSFLKI